MTTAPEPPSFAAMRSVARSVARWVARRAARWAAGRTPLPFLPALVLAAGVATASPARAGEDEIIAAIEPGYAALISDRDPRHGLGLSVSGWFGTDSPFWLAAAADVTGHFDLDDDPLTLGLLAGIVYAFDVFQVIPYIEAFGGLVTGRGGPAPTARLGLGFDYLVARTVSVGAVARYRPLADPLGDGLVTGHIRLAVRLEY